MTLTQAEWANAAFTLSFAALLLPAGWLGDRFGQRRTLAVGVLVFVAGTVLVGTAGGLRRSSPRGWSRASALH